MSFKRPSQLLGLMLLGSMLHRPLPDELRAPLHEEPVQPKVEPPRPPFRENLNREERRGRKSKKKYRRYP